MKIAIIVVRTLMGLLFLFGSITYLFNLAPDHPVTGNMKIFLDGLIASGYILTLVKVLELVCGLALIAGLFVPLALVVLSPIIINILMVHTILDTSGLPVAIFLVLANSFLAYAHWDKFRPLMSAK